MSLIKAIGGKISDTTAKIARLDASTHSWQIVDYEHHEIHSGSHFELCEVVDLAINNVFDLQFTTPNTTKWTHFIFQISSESETEYYIYENVVINTAGTTETPLNNNRNSINTSVNTLASHLNTSLANANADTDVSGAITYEHQIIGAGRSSQGSNTRSREIVLKQNTSYCLRAIAKAAGYVNFCAQWYEHTDKD